MRIIFMGTPEFAVDSLDALVKSKHQVVAVICQPDKPTERGNKIEFCAVKKYALANSIPLFQYPKVSRDGIIDIKALEPDLIVTVAYGQILSNEILDIPKYGVINVHGSLLPKYRGASPIQSAIIHGDSETGVTIMKTESGLDTGDIISSVKTQIFENETFGDLSDRLSKLGAILLLETIDEIQNGTAIFTKQEHFNASITKKIEKSDTFINWEKSAKEIKCLILGTNPNPIARTSISGSLVKIYRAKVADTDFGKDRSDIEVGTVLPESSPKKGIFVKCGNGTLEILEMQLPGGKILTGKEILNGRKINVNDKFSSEILR